MDITCVSSVVRKKMPFNLYQGKFTYMDVHHHSSKIPSVRYLHVGVSCLFQASRVPGDDTQ